MKNSGGFRLIRNKTVANKIIAYDQFNNDAIRNIALQHNKFFENTVALRSRVFTEKVITEIFKLYGHTPAPYTANKWIDSLMGKNKVPLTAENQTVLFFEFKNALIALKRDYDMNMNWGYSNLQKSIDELIQVIQENYHIK